jgi:hypothetical protein
VAGSSTPLVGEEAKAYVHHPAMEKWDKTKQTWNAESDLSKARVARHEVLHTQQPDRAMSQVGSSGPLRKNYDALGNVTPEGFRYNEREAYMDDLDRMLQARQTARDQALRNPAGAEQALEIAKNAEAEIKHARDGLDYYGAPSPRPSTYDPALVPKVGAGAPDVPKIRFRVRPDDVTLP